MQTGRGANQVPRVPCPHCASPVTLTPAQLNRTIRCGSCQKEFVVHFGITPAADPDQWELKTVTPAKAIQTSQKAVVAPPAPLPPKPRWTRVRVSARLLHWPRMCAGCGGASEVSREASCTSSDSRGKARTRTWAIPYCSKCSGSIKRGEAGESVRYEDFHASIHEFHFWSQEYAEAFKEMNRDKLLAD